ncbi:MAG: sialidase family protein [Terriglobales bacterium]
MAFLAGMMAVAALPQARPANPIQVGPNVRVSSARPSAPHREVVLAADPHNAKRLLACSMFSDAVPGVHSTAYVSFDQGRTWQLGATAEDQFADDPTCAYGPDGTAYFIAKTETLYPRKGSSNSDALFIRRSPDGGRTWLPVIHGPLANDRPFMAIDTGADPFRGRLYVSFDRRIYSDQDTGQAGIKPLFANATWFETSRDGGLHFDTVYIRALLDRDPRGRADAITAATVVLPDGAVAVLQSHGIMGGSNRTTHKPFSIASSAHVFISRDGGLTFSSHVVPGLNETSYNSSAVRAVPGTMTADDSASPWRGRMYIAWTQMLAGRARVLFTSSSDSGRTWSSPVPLDDNQAHPGGGPDDFQPAIAVNRKGVVGLLWYDRRDIAGDRGYYARFRASLDGGQHWLPSVRIATAPNAPPAAGAHRRYFVNGGDTSGLAADADGTFHALWIDNRTGVEQVWTAAIKVAPSQ